MRLSLGAVALFGMAMAFGGPVACASADSEQGEDETAEGALIPAQLFSAACKVSIPSADGTPGIATVAGRFGVGADGTLSAADGVPVRFKLPTGEEETVKLRSGKVIDAENDVFALTVTYGIFKVEVLYDGSMAAGKKQNVRIVAPLKGAKNYDGSCTFKDEAGRTADGKVAPST